VVIGKGKEGTIGGRRMRPIKFRAWDKKFKKMYEGDIRIVLAFPNDDVEIMQFTGLKDKNGKEIYQFDLWKLGDEIYLIVWKEGDWQTGWKKLAGDNYTDIGKDNAKSGLIIGNLLENPDLLNVPSCSENEKDE
jgi:hypothetical protein